MNSDARADLIRQATDGLALRAIWLNESRFTRPQPLPVGDSVELVQQQMHGVSARDGQVEEQGASQRILQVTVALGTRLVGTTPADDPPIHFVIEASFQVEYEMRSELSEDAIRAFAEFNAIHNVWPFWRQHVFDIVQRGDLPKLQVPLFSGMKL